MPDKRRPIRRWVMGALLLAALLLTGCAPRTGMGETTQAAAQAASPAPLLLDLPALILTYDADGAPSIGGLPPAALSALLPETLVHSLTLHPTTVQQVTDAGIQHIMVSNTPTGLRVLVNGQPLPTLVWDQESLDNLLALLEETNQPIGAPGDLATSILNLGLGVVVQFPLAAGVEPIPLLAGGKQSNAARAEAGRQAFLERAGAAPVVQIPVQYTVDGTWSVGGVTDTEWQALTGLPFGYVRLNPQVVQDAAAAGIRQVMVWTDADGIHLTIGERRLPYLRWADGNVLTLLHLLEALGYLPFDSQAHPDAYQWIEQELLPALQATNLRIVVSFAPD